MTRPKLHPGDHMTITEFLTERYDEDAAVARAAGGSPWKPFPRWVAGETNNAGIRREDGVPVAGHSWPREMEHIARFDPSRVLADIAAKRAIVALHWEASEDWGRTYSQCYTCELNYPCPTVRTLAQPYAAHPDFDSTWRI